MPILKSDMGGPRKSRSFGRAPQPPDAGRHRPARRELDLGDLAGHEAQPRHVAPQLGERVRRQGHALRRTQRLQTPRRLAQGRPEAADAEARQATPHPVDDAGALADQALPLPVRALGVLFLERRDRDHAAVVRLAAQPAEEGPPEQPGVEPVRLRPPMLARTATLVG